MKSNASSPLYFSAYPLKAITASASSAPTNQSPYLRSVLAGGKTKASSRIRIFPMVNPYKLEQAAPSKPSPRQAKPARDIEVSGDEWFNHYE